MSVRDTITAYAEKQYPVYRQLALEIHAHPEVSNYEFFACEHLSEQMKKEGFQVTVDVPGHRTGFTGVYKAAKPGPVLVFLAEYDALVGLGMTLKEELLKSTLTHTTTAATQGALMNKLW